MAPSRAADTTTTSGPAPGLVVDAALQPFLAADFDPIEHLNATLPSLTLSPSNAHVPRQSQPLALSEVSTRTQALLSQLSAQTTRLSEDLTQLTDEILRSGARLTYEVEVLRSETTGLTGALTDWLRDDINGFVPTVLTDGAGHSDEDPAAASSRLHASRLMGEVATDQDGRIGGQEDRIDPPYITQLRTLTLVRSRLESVISIFGEAMQWTLSPSESSVASSFISVSAPESSSDVHGREQKGKDIAKKLRDEVSNTLASNGDVSSGIVAAMKRIEQLRDLATVWKGTAEEKPRNKFVDSLAKMVEDRARSLEKDVRERRHREERGPTASPRPPAVSPSKSGRPSGEHDRSGRSTGEGGPGFFRNLQRLRDEIYLD
ncbi:hypothetical protein MMC16_003469 [Acarospora aff. strigata]|nr:hypothetical protein [Acarospora aff. strigata]